MDGIIDGLLGTLGQFIYPLFSVLFGVIDLVQKVFKSFAGIGIASHDGTSITNGNSGDVDDNGLVFYLLNQSLVKNMIVSIGVLALFLLIIFTVMAFIKNAYSEKPKGWKDIISNTIKGGANFILLPVIVLFSMWLGNILLQAIDGATSYKGSTQLSRKLFITAAYDANRVRAQGLSNGSWWDNALTKTEKFPR